jgi:ribonuclease D
MRSLVELRAYRPDARRLYLRVSGNARMSRRELGILNELATLRDRLARERNIPLKFIMPDDVLAGLVALRPHSVDELGQLRRLEGGVKKHYGAAILQAIAHGEAIPEDDLPQRAPRPLGPQREALVATMAVLVNAIAAENDLPTTLLLSRHALERIARETPRSAEAIDESLSLTPWRRGLIVEPLWELLAGRRVVRVEGYLEGNPHTTFVAPEPAD